MGPSPHDALGALRGRIEARAATIGVVGLGYVGVTVAAAFAEAGFRVVGVDVKRERVESVARGDAGLSASDPDVAALLAGARAAGRLVATTEHARLREADAILVDVETPIDAARRPAFDALRAACASIGRAMKPGALVVVESTLAPGTCRDLVAPALEAASGARLGDGFFLGHCPERVMPGKLLANLRALPRVCGGASAETAAVVVALYRAIVRGALTPADLVTAEIVKAAENAYRDVNIAFANELARVCEASGADFWAVRELVNQSPGRDVLLAGPGVGGACMPKDPWLLAAGARGFEPRLVAAARAVNDAMPAHVEALVAASLDAAGVPLAGARVALLGVAYLENASDARESPSLALAERLRARGATVVLHDPCIAAHAAKDAIAACEGADVAVVMVAHDAYRDLDLPRLARALRTNAVVDARDVIAPRDAAAAGLALRSLGRPAP